MALFDVENLLREISPEAPSGEDLSYDQSYGELEEASKGTPERVVGDSVIPAKAPIWRDVLDQSTELLTKTKDLQVGVFLTLSALKLDGHPGLRDGLAVVRGMLDRYWDGVHPQLDPDDDNDPDFRINVLEQISDAMMFVQPVRQAPICDIRGRTISYRDTRIAAGEVTPVGDETPVEQSVIDAMFSEVDVEQVQATLSAVEESVASCEAIEAVFAGRVGPQSTPNLTDLRAVLGDIRKELNTHLSRRGYGTAPTVDDQQADGSSEPGTPATADARPLSGDIASREDVIQALDKICRYYERFEPSSPVPMLLRRAKQLVTKNFLDIIRDIVPDALSSVESLGGVDTDASAE